MKKKLVAILLSACVAASLAACGNSDNAADKTEPQAKTESNATEEKQVTKEKDLPDGDYQDMGNGTMYISTAGGTSENGNVPVVFVSDEILLQIGLNTSAFDGSKLSFIYVDGMLATKEQLSDSQITLDLSEDMLTVGNHKVEVTQYENDDPTGNMVTYKQAAYEVKAK